MTTFILKRKTYALSPEQHAYQRGLEAGIQKGNSTATEAALQNAKNSVGLRQGATNAWNRMGNWGKVGTVAGGTAALIGGGYLMGKGAGLWGNNNKN